MALKFKQEDNAFVVEGTLNATTVKQFINHLEFLLLYTKGVTLYIDNVKSIDATGLKAIENLHEKALSYNKPLTILGYACKDNYGALTRMYAA